MTWRILLGKLSFPLLVGVSLLWSWSAYSRHAEQEELERIGEAAAKAADRQASYDAHHMATAMLRDVTNCGIKDWGEKPVNVDGDPRHAVEVLWTRLQCDEGVFTMRGRLPKLVTQR